MWSKKRFYKQTNKTKQYKTKQNITKYILQGSYMFNISGPGSDLAFIHDLLWVKVSDALA